MEKNRRKREGGRREKTKSDSSGGENKGNPMREQEGEIQFRRGTDAEQESGQDVGKRNKNGGWKSKVSQISVRRRCMDNRRLCSCGVVMGNEHDGRRNDWRRAARAVRADGGMGRFPRRALVATMVGMERLARREHGGRQDDEQGKEGTFGERRTEYFNLLPPKRVWDGGSESNEESNTVRWCLRLWTGTSPG